MLIRVFAGDSGLIVDFVMHWLRWQKIYQVYQVPVMFLSVKRALMPCVNSQGPDQPRHLCNLFRNFSCLQTFLLYLMILFRLYHDKIVLWKG